ncbi:hypothetical protein [Gandjariella thermophila]|uniref:Uncharacterized protein n=1 Tax=Gandjariella thermophila TaxID=1931992 RepID=A0A4D4J6J7_9PSEU|nr:hypothetical protein [Gandjariella thermophila]GDY30670.1 hypothetical protein GTS_23030 [Gandjariella thermophila]
MDEFVDHLDRIGENVGRMGEELADTAEQYRTAEDANRDVLNRIAAWLGRRTATVRSERHPEVAAEIGRSDFTRWMRRNRWVARSIRVERDALSAQWRHGLYGAALLRRLRFLMAAGDRLDRVVGAR